MTPGSTKLIDVLNCPSLPSLPTVAVQLLDLTSDPDVDMKDIAQLVSTDQALSAKVLKTVNSSYYGLSSACGSIERALGYLGLNTVKSLVLGFSLVETTALAGDNGFDLMGHWRRAIMGATGARAIAKQLAIYDPDEVFTAALFQDMGMLAAFTVLKEEYSNAIDETPHRIVCAAEADAFGFDHTEAGEALAELWNLPKDICDAIRYHHNPEDAMVDGLEIIRAVALGALLADAMSSKSPEIAIRQLESQSTEWFGLNNSLNTESLLVEIAESSQTLAKMFETDIGEIPNPLTLMAQAQEKGLELQINAQKQADTLARESVTDGLTQIPNRKRFDTGMSAQFGEFLTNERPLSVLFFDADKFKSVNDTYGHAAGDRVLIELAQRATDAVGTAGMVCRYGGEEFVAILPNMSVNDAAKIAERVRSMIADTPFDTSGLDGVPDELPVTVSVGVSGTDAGSPSRLENPVDLVLEADKCVYEAKEAGRNNVKVWSQILTVSDTQEQATSADSTEISGAQPTVAVGGSVLLIEDDALAATLIMSLLKRWSAATTRIEWIRTGNEAQSRITEFAKTNSCPFDLIVCDLDLPGSHGLEILGEMRKIEAMKETPFFILTAHGGHSDKRRAEELGVTEFIAKSEFCSDVSKWMNKLIESGAIEAKAA